METDTKGYQNHVVWRVYGMFHVLTLLVSSTIFKYKTLCNFIYIYRRGNILFVPLIIYGLERILKVEVQLCWKIIWIRLVPWWVDHIGSENMYGMDYVNIGVVINSRRKVPKQKLIGHLTVKDLECPFTLLALLQLHNIKKTWLEILLFLYINLLI